MSAAVKKKAACTCCGSTDPACPDGMCPAGSLYRVACGGAHQYVQQVEIDGVASKTTTASGYLQIPIHYASGGYGGSGVFRGTTTPFTRTVATAFTLSTPVAPPGPQSGNYSTFGVDVWQGVYKRLTVNGTTYVFDGTIGLGITPTSATFAVGHDAAAWPAYPRSPNAAEPGEPYLYFDVLSDPTAVYERLNVLLTLTAFPSVSAGTGLYQVYAAASATFDTAVKLRGRWTNVNTTTGEEFPDLAQWLLDFPNLSQGFSAYGDNTANADVCHGYETHANLVDGTTTIGTFTAKLIDPDDGEHGVSAGDYAIRNCPCAIRVSGTVYVTVRTDTGKPIDANNPPKLDPDSEDYESPPSALGPATVDVRMVRAAGKGCGHPGALWENVGPVHYNANGESSLLTGKLTVGDVDYPLDYTELRRIGPRLYALSGNFTGAETYDGESNSASGTGAFGLHFTTSADCPTDLAEVEQFAQAFNVVRPGVPYYASDPTVEPVFQFQNPAVTELLTANEIAVEAVDRQDGDPACGCNESTTYHASLAAAAHVQSILDEDAAAGATA